MPLYEYQCETCGRFERIVKFSDPPLESCPTCGGQVQKLFSSPAIQFKGSGWYITDYAKKSSGESSGGNKPAPKPSDASSSSSGGDSGSSEKSKGDTAASAPAPAASASKE